MSNSCLCGCGQYPANSNARYAGDHWRTPLLTRLYGSLILDSSGCVLWTGVKEHGGYGMVWANGKTRLVHRVLYELLAGPIPDGLTLDHLCRVRHCANVAHLEAVSMAVNVLRGQSPSAANARKTHCRRGHALTGLNLRITGGRRCCRACARIRQQEYRAAASAS